MHINPLLAIDFYKVDHRRQYPSGTTEIYSNFTPRYIKKSSSLLPDFDNKVVVFGIQYLIKTLLDSWDKGFFSCDKDTIVWEYHQIVCDALGLEEFDCSHIAALHDLGYLPIRIKAIHEGFRIPIGVPVLTIVNTEPEFFWLTNYLETVISATLWKPMTVATIAFEFRRLLRVYAKKTCNSSDHVRFQAHDFSFRGLSGLEDAAVCGAAHLTSFQGTDCVPAIAMLNEYYAASAHVTTVGSSVAASEHSVMCCDSVEGELETIRRLIVDIYPSGIVSIVADSYDFWRTITVYLKELKPLIMERQGTVVIRPDSGNPVDIICGDISAPSGSPAHKGALECLWELFGGTVNAMGYKLLDSHIGLIYGDGITVDRASLILELMEQKGFASSNIIFGVGSYSYQYITRDTFGFSMKATSCMVEGERRAIFKDPKTDSGGKRSAKGLLQVQFDHETANFLLKQDCSETEEKESYLELICEDGKIIQTTNLAEIRYELTCEVDNM